MKKLLTILLSLMLILSLVACGAKSTGNSDDSDDFMADDFVNEEVTLHP